MPIAASSKSFLWSWRSDLSCTSRRTRSRISVAAASVKVTAAISGMRQSLSRGQVALDQNVGLAAARACGDQHIAAAMGNDGRLFRS